MSDKEVFISVNSTVLTTKCDDGREPQQITAKGANIISLEPGCKIHSASFKVSRSKQMFIEEVSARLINSPAVPIWTLLSEKADEEEMQSFLKEMLNDEPSGLTIPDIESKFHLHTISRRSHINRTMTLSVSAVITVVVLGGVLYFCRNNLTCANKQKRQNMKVTLSGLMDSIDTVDTYLESGALDDSSTPIAPASKGKKKRTSTKSPSTG